MATQRSLVGCSPWGLEESDMIEWLHFHFSLSCIGEGNGNPLQSSCLENPRNGGQFPKKALLYFLIGKFKPIFLDFLSHLLPVVPYNICFCLTVSYNPWVEGEITRKIRSYIELNENLKKAHIHIWRMYFI